MESAANQISLRGELSRVRGEISELVGQLASLRGRESAIKSQITPKKERCQRCRGSGRVLTRCCHSGVEDTVPCSYCGGTGQWSEPV